jgi:hypothetical protein
MHSNMRKQRREGKKSQGGKKKKEEGIYMTSLAAALGSSWGNGADAVQ